MDDFTRELFSKEEKDLWEFVFRKAITGFLQKDDDWIMGKEAGRAREKAWEAVREYRNAMRTAPN